MEFKLWMLMFIPERLTGELWSLVQKRILMFPSLRDSGTPSRTSNPNYTETVHVTETRSAVITIHKLLNYELNIFKNLYTLLGPGSVTMSSNRILIQLEKLRLRKSVKRAEKYMYESRIKKKK